MAKKKFQSLRLFQRFQPLMERFERLYAPTLLRNIDTVALGVMDTILRERDSIWPCRSAPHAGFFRPLLHLIVAFDEKPEMIESQRLLFPLIKKRQIDVAVGNENRR